MSTSGRFSCLQNHPSFVPKIQVSSVICQTAENDRFERNEQERS